MENTAIRLPPDQIESLDRIAIEKRATRSMVIRWAIDHYLGSYFSAERTIGVSSDTAECQTPDQS